MLFGVCLLFDLHRRLRVIGIRKGGCSVRVSKWIPICMHAFTCVQLSRQDIVDIVGE